MLCCVHIQCFIYPDLLCTVFFSRTACFAFIVRLFHGGELPFTDHTVFNWTAPLKHLVWCFLKNTSTVVIMGQNEEGFTFTFSTLVFAALLWITLSVQDYFSNYWAAPSNISLPWFHLFLLVICFTIEWNKLLRGTNHKIFDGSQKVGYWFWHEQNLGVINYMGQCKMLRSCKSINKYINLFREQCTLTDIPVL